MDEIGHKQDEERHGVDQQAVTSPFTDVIVVDIVHDIEASEDTCQEHHGKPQDEHPGIEQGVKAVGSVGPAADDGSHRSKVDHVVLLNDEVRAFEERGNGTT